MDLLVCAATAVLLFLCFALGYKEGLRLGMRAARGLEPEKIKTPLEVVEAHKERKETVAQAQVFDDFMSHDGYTARERDWMRGERG